MPMTAGPEDFEGGRWVRLLSRFLHGQAGNVAVIFALAGLPLLFLTGAVIDYGFATRVQTKLQAAADATTLTLCQTPLATPTAQLQAQAVILMGGYMGATAGMTVDPLVVTSNPREITLTAHIPSPSFFPRVTGVTASVVKGRSQCASPMPATFEIALVLDNTGSMSESSGGQSKIQALQKAAGDFVDYVKNNGAFSPDTRIAIVPFAAAVAVDPTAYRNALWVDTHGLSQFHWINVDQHQALAAGFVSRFSIFDKLKQVDPSWDWAGCFEALPYPQSVQDTVPTHPDTLYVPMLAPDEPADGNDGTGRPTYACWDAANDNNCRKATATTYNSYLNDGDGTSECSSAPGSYMTAEKQACKYVSPRGAKPGKPIGIPNGPNFQCTSKPLQRLTTDSTVLKTLINSMFPSGSTNIFDGVMWGWRTLSPYSVFADGAAYGSTTKKVMILMTDGYNSWPGFSGNPNGSLYFPFGYMNNADGSTPAARLPPGHQNPNSDNDRRAALDELTIEACTNAKATGISIYTIGFSIPSDPIDKAGQQMLQNCASAANQAFIANDSNGLISAFSQIAQSIGALRISQ